MSTVSDIFSYEDENGKKLLSDRLQAYIEGKLTSEEQHEVEKWLSEQGLESDAIDGLQSLKADEAKTSVLHLDRHLHKYLSEKKQRSKRYYKSNSWIWVAIFVILLCCMLGYMVIHYVIN